ncbi:hypothetical protein BDN71DRAFT_1508755 [Pleurotus eryngii]|uniref:Uncharacterized protein n=1 Tax=Pleurotus eryngii TaxID=5323 RepID=A0A9P5ZUY2_PLEER|nr:hypothetical protein BDN71DRAFT_1508755 [Pleurotus eryngii]
MSPNLPDLVIREVASDIWVFSRPFPRFGFLPWGGRSTAVKLSTGDVWVLASTPLTDDTKETIDKLGPVKWIMGADAVHHLFLAEYKTAYPEAKVIGVEPLVEKKKAEGLILDGAYGSDPPGTLYGFEDEIKACYFSGYASVDVAWLHVASKTLIQADLLFNLPGTEQYSKTKMSPKIPIFGKLDPYGNLQKRFLWAQGKDKKTMMQDARTVAEWDFERVIPCHGDVIETDGKKAWVMAYSKYLKL